MQLTESFAMYPAAAVSGYYFSHPQSQYFVVGRVSREQVDDYAQRKGVDRCRRPSAGWPPTSITTPNDIARWCQALLGTTEGHTLTGLANADSSSGSRSRVGLYGDHELINKLIRKARAPTKQGLMRPPSKRTLLSDRKSAQLSPDQVVGHLVLRVGVRVVSGRRVRIDLQRDRRREDRLGLRQQFAATSR